MGGGRPVDRQHQRLSLWTQFHPLRHFSYQVGGQDGLGRAIDHPLVRVCVRTQLALRIPGRSSTNYGPREWLERSDRQRGQTIELGRECQHLFGPEHELRLAFHQLEHGVSVDPGGTHPFVARVLGCGGQYRRGESSDRFVAGSDVPTKRTR